MIVQKARVSLHPKTCHLALTRWRLNCPFYRSQCLERRISDRQLLESEIAAWEQQRNREQASVNWRFQTAIARKKMERLYPTI